MKGFIEIIVIGLIVTGALILLATNSAIAEENNPGQEIAETAFFINAFEKTITKSATDCIWETTEALNLCIMQKSTEIMQELSNEKINCTVEITTIDLTTAPKNAELKYACETNNLDGKNTQVSVSKQITLKDITPIESP